MKLPSALRHSLALCFALLSLLTLHSQAHAGYWTVDHYDRSGYVQHGGMNYYSDGPGTYAMQEGAQQIERRDNVITGGSDVSSVDMTWGNNWQSAPGYKSFYKTQPRTFAAKGDVSISATLKWHRNQTMTGTDDPNDNPPKRVYVLEGVSIGAYKWANPSPWSGTGVTVTGTVGAKGLKATLELYYYNVSNYGLTGNDVKVHSYAVPGDTVTLPTVKFKGQVTLSPGYEQTSQGASNMVYSYVVTPLNLTLEPDPKKIAVDDGSLKGLNQYVIDGIMPTSIITGNSTADAIIKDSAHWSLTGDIPLRTPDQITIGQRANSLGSANNGVIPLHNPLPEPPTTPEPSLTPMPPYPGFEFGVKYHRRASSNSNEGWNFPDDNSKFGPQVFTHEFDNIKIKADVALFYPSIGFQHPEGGPPGHYVLGFNGHFGTIDTPNWFYYYSQAWSPPCPIAYWDRDYSNYVHGSDHVHIGNYVYGPGRGAMPLFEMRSGVITWVGYYYAYGLDVFARTVTHEATHKQIWESYHQSISDAEDNDIPDIVLDDYGFIILDENGHVQAQDPDADPDDDGIPTWYERSVGLNPTNPDTTGFNAGGGYDGDSEAIARFRENQIGTLPDRNLDWANDGLNWGYVPGGLPTNRIRRTDRNGNSLP